MTTQFIIRNISRQRKDIKIFNFRILYGYTKDLLTIFGISEAYIRQSLLSGELKRKINYRDIEIVYSNIDLLQFDTDQKVFLEAAGIEEGLDCTGDIGFSSVANLAVLAALTTEASGYVYVNTLLCFWKRNTTSVLTPDGITIVAAVGGGNWERIVSTTAFDWLSQAVWYINPVAGNDENIGSVAAPIATFIELNRRISVGSIRQNTTINIPAGTTISSANLEVDTGGFLLTINGVVATSYTGSVNVYTERSHITPEASLLTDNILTDYTPYVGTRIRTTSGTSAIAWFAGVSPGGVGVNVAAVSRFGGVPNLGTGAIPAMVVPVHNVSYVIETLPIITKLSITQKSSPPASLATQVAIQIKNIAIGGATDSRFSITTAALSGVNIDGCSLDCYSTYRCGLVPNITRSKIGGPINNQHLFTGEAVYRDCLIVKTISIKGSSSWQLYQCLIYGTTGSAGSITQIQTYGAVCELRIYDSQIFNSSSFAIEFLNAGNIWCRGGLSGSRNAIGLLVGDADDEAVVGQVFCWATSADIPNLLGTTTPIRIVGTTNIDLAWAAMPFNSDEQHGLGTLTDGYTTITARNSNIRGVFVNKATPIGLPQGILVVPTETRTISQFVVNAINLTTGAVVATDLSTFNWFIPGMARRITICASSAIT
jgi:hypothetical protein